MNNKEAKIVGGFLVGAGLITYLMYKKKHKSCKISDCVEDYADQAEKKAKKLSKKAHRKMEEAREEGDNIMDKIVGFAADNRHAISDTISYFFDSVLKKR